jgi:hypothetical protein
VHGVSHNEPNFSDRGERVRRARQVLGRGSPDLARSRRTGVRKSGLGDRIDLMPVHQPALVSALLALQFVAFGWRINREIAVGDEDRKTWLPLPDYLNVALLLTVVFCCVVTRSVNWPLPRTEAAVLSFGYVMIAFHPVSEAAHYRLFSKSGRSIYLKKPGDDFPWATGQETLTVALSLIFAAAAAYFTIAGFSK